MGNRWGRKLTVEECPYLEAKSLAKEILQAGFRPGFSGGFHIFEMELQYDVKICGQLENEEMWIQLFETPTIFGGHRWWFKCPIFFDGSECNRKVGKLYLPPGKRYYGCRHCHNLTYRSVQEHDKRVDFYRKNPEALLAALEAPYVKFSTMLLAMKTVR